MSQKEDGPLREFPSFS